jgi:hypothetical protein
MNGTIFPGLEEYFLRAADRFRYMPNTQIPNTYPLKKKKKLRGGRLSITHIATPLRVVASRSLHLS